MGKNKRLRFDKQEPIVRAERYLKHYEKKCPYCGRKFCTFYEDQTYCCADHKDKHQEIGLKETRDFVENLVKKYGNNFEKY